MTQTEPTDAELTEALAKVMGWHRIPAGQPFREGVIALTQDAYFDADNKIAMMVADFCPLHLTKGHNHMALVRAKMRERCFCRYQIDWLYTIGSITQITYAYRKRANVGWQQAIFIWRCFMNLRQRQ